MDPKDMDQLRRQSKRALQLHVSMIGELPSEYADQMHERLGMAVDDLAETLGENLDAWLGAAIMAAATTDMIGATGKLLGAESVAKDTGLTAILLICTRVLAHSMTLLALDGPVTR